MILRDIVNLIIILNYVSAQQWTEPWFIPNPEVEDQVQLQQVAGGALIYMNENINNNIVIAFLNYAGETEPIISKSYEPPNSNAATLLGAKFEKNNQWQLVITASQDFESGIIKYSFDIKVEEVSARVYLSINNLDDETPFIETKACKINERFVGPSECIYTISDADGVLNDYAKYTLSSDVVPNIEETFKMQNEDDFFNGALRWTTRLVVLKELDFETIPSYILDFEVTDYGGHTSTIKIVIEVKDLPDTEPVWRRIFSSATFPEKQEQTFVVQATDGDIGINADINYNISSDWPDLFKIDKESGVITIEKIDRDSLGIELFLLEVVAYEKDNISSSTSQTITIVVNDQNDHTPEITVDKTSVTIWENSVSTLDIKIDIKDLDMGENAKYKVSLVDSIYSKAFQIVPTSAYQNATFTISVLNSTLLDYEDPDWREIKLIIRSEEEFDASHFEEQPITISLKNRNDELPRFDKDEYIKIVAEDVKAGFEIITVHAIDDDIGDSVKYSLLGTEINTKFSIDSNGTIKTKTDNTLDYEKQTMLFIQIVAEDTLEEPYHKTFGQLIIEVQDVNDEAPSINVAPNLISVNENQPNETLINVDTSIVGSDNDQDALLVFSIDWSSSYAVKNGQRVDFPKWIYVETQYGSKKGTANALLKVLETNPEKTPDYESFDTMYISLVVTDKDQKVGVTQSAVQVTIIINDVNDEKPIFIDNTINSVKNVVEGAKKDTRVGIITAIDNDGPNNNKIIYSLRPQDANTPEGWIDIDPNSGELFVSADGTIVADLPIDELKYVVTAINDPDWTEEAIITIEVIDTNNNDPVCTFQDIVHILEKTPNGTIIPQSITCTDKDRDEQYNIPRFRFSSSATDVKNLFSINELTGEVFVDIKGDYELNRDTGISTYTIPFIVRDQEENSGANIKDYSFTIILDDINDNAPIIQTNTISGIETLKEKTTLGEITAIDIDEKNKNNARVNFEVVSITKGSDAGADPPKDLYKIVVEDEYSGKGKLITNYDLRGYYGTYIVLIKAFDYGSPESKSSTKEVEVVIEKYNFVPPIFIYPSSSDTEPLYLSRIQEIGQPLIHYDGTPLDPFKASDQQNEKWDIRITVNEATNPNGLFTLSKSGKSEAILLLTALPSFSGTYEIKIIANCNCNGDEPYTTTLTIQIRFINKDSEPIFLENSISLDFPENNTEKVTVLPRAYFNKAGEEWDLFTPYYFLTEDSSGAFSVDKISGELKLLNALDREEMSNVSLQIVASQNSNGNSNPEESSILTVLVKIEDINDNPPNFNKNEFYTGIQAGNLLGSVILVITASDLDVTDELDIFMLPETLESHGNGINTMQYPFYIEAENQYLDDRVIGKGNLHLNFSVQTNMDGYFTFQTKVIDKEQHETITSVKIYILSDSSMLVVQFSNNVSTVIEKQEQLRRAFEDNVGYRCNIESIVSSTDEAGQPLPDQTDVTMHFVNDETNEAVNSDEVRQILSSIQVMRELRAQLAEDGLLLLNVDKPVVPENSEEILRTWLIIVSVVLGTLCLTLIIASIIKIKSLTSRLNKLSMPKFGSQESGLNRIGLAAPNTNKHAIEGSNPVYNNEKKAPEIDRFSMSSGDSDLIGIEDNPNFYNKPRDSKNSLFKEPF